MKNHTLMYWAVVIVISLFTFSSCNNGIYEDDFEDIEQTEEQEENNETNTHDHGESSEFIAQYSVNGNIISLKGEGSANENWMQDPAKHQEIWDLVTRLIPEDRRSWITEFEIIDGGGNLYGYVSPIDEGDVSRWKMGLAIDISYVNGAFDKDKELTYTIIHEFAHGMSLNETQLNANADSCPTFDPGEGCTYQAAYLNLFYQRFWTEIYQEHQDNDVENDEDTAYDFYQKYQGHFVTEYASTNPIEDLAEVFAVFVTSDTKPQGTAIKDKKIQFMYEFPELVSLRTYMKEKGEARMKPGTWKKAYRFAATH